MLEVVQHQQNALVLYVLQQRLLYRLPACFAQVESAGYRGDNHRRTAQRCQLYQVHSVLEIPQEGGRYLYAQAGLTRTRRTGDGEQAHFGLPEPAAYLIKLMFPADEGSERQGQVALTQMHSPPGGVRVGLLLLIVRVRGVLIGLSGGSRIRFRWAEGASEGDKCLPLVRRHLKQLCQLESDLPGRAAFSSLNLLQSYRGARRLVGQVISGDA